MRGHNICSDGEILKIITKLSLLLLFIWSPAVDHKDLCYCKIQVFSSLVLKELSQGVLLFVSVMNPSIFILGKVPSHFGDII